MKWIAGIVVALVALGVGSYVALSRHLKEHPAYEVAERFLADSESLATHVGGNVRFGRLPAVTLTEDQARYRMDVRGLSRRTHALVELRLAGREWIVSTASFEVADDVWESIDVPRRQSGTVADGLVEEAKELNRSGDWQAALEHLDEALSEDRGNARAWYWKGRIHSDRGEVDLAATEFENALIGDPDFKDAYQRLNNILISRADWDGAVAWWGRYLARHPDDAAVHAARAQVLRRMGDFDGARSDEERACELGHRASCRRVSGEPSATDEGQVEEEPVEVEEEPAEEEPTEEEPEP